MSRLTAATGRGGALVGMAAFVVTSACWGANMPITAVIFRVLDPFWMSPWRTAIAALTLAVLLAATEGVRALAMPMPWRRFLMLSCAMASFFLVYNLALRHTNTITAAAFMVGSPVYAALTLRVLTGAAFDRGFWVAAPLTLVGGAIAVWGRADAPGAGFALQGGEPLIVLCTVFWTVYSIYAQRWFEPPVTQLRRTYVALSGATLWLFLFWAACRAAGVVGPPNLAPDAATIGWLALTAVFATGLAGVTWNIGVARLGIPMGSLWQNAVPVFAILISMAFGFEPTPAQIAGGAIVMAGVLYMQWRKFNG
ncbi:MAG: DMT family transporter [Rhodospirillales bacterium]|nr:MAG: DMT family transporter [Rhodospirillales bacterium]